MRALICIFILALFGSIASSSLCTDYAAILGVSEEVLMNSTVTDVAIAVATCGPTCPTAAWFNGTNGRAGTDFLTNPEAFNSLVGKLMGYFGQANALGCSAAFTNKFPAPTVDMRSAHAEFQKPVDRAAFEYFNQAVIRVLAGYGVSNADLATVAKYLDGFRAHKTGAAPNNVICQAADCTKSPFSVKVAADYFNPPFMTVPRGTVVEFVKEDFTPHIVVESNSTNKCLATSDPVFELDLTGSPRPVFTDGITKPLTFVDILNCNITGEFAVKGSSSASSITHSLIAAMFIVIFALL